MVDQPNKTISEYDRKMQELHDLLKQEEMLSKIQYDQKYFERFLFSSNFEVAEAFKRMKLFYDLLFQYPEWMTKEPPVNKRHLIDKEIRVALPDTDKEGRPIYLVKIGNVDCNTMSLTDVVAVDDIWLESIILNSKACKQGLCVIVDIANYPWRMIKWLTPHNIKLSLRKLESIPIKEYRFHIVNQATMIHAAIKLTWPLLPEYIKEMVKFHWNDRESLHNHIDPKVLPLEYGGFNHKLDYQKINTDLYEQNEQIHMSFKRYREVALK
ncbi:uncharacterized protein LOC115886207 [Sitophilus oryzae]|uniref:Uncharacterized protein LOC115886207 n=1 Tax=Sitophilus oryzae TaxID=7048 RepID=A0A6J2YD93_SITOR|nr:uncharacterized protein LOC115886207 [Sitophilus oryzae]